MDPSTQIHSTVAAMTNAFQSGDVDAVMQTYEPTAVVLSEPGVAVRGTEPLRAMFRDFIAGSPNFTFGEHEVVAGEGVALHLMPWHMTAMTPDGQPLVVAGLSVAVLRRQLDGQWLMAIDHPYGDAILRSTPGDTDANRGAR